MAVYYVPAGVEDYHTTGPATLYTKLEKHKQEKTSFLFKAKEWETKDQHILLCRHPISEYLPEISYDSCVSIHSPTMLKHLGIKVCLANPQVGKYSKIPFKNQGILTILDSGGFQMLSGKMTFVNPDDVVSRYNANADIGMPLDIPVKAIVEQQFFDRVSRIMKANDNYMIPKLNNDVTLSLISHGTTLDYRKRRLDILDRDTKVVTIAGLNINPKGSISVLPSKVEQLMYVVSRYRKTTQYFHVLGVTEKLFLFLYCLLDSLGYVKNIGADSVTHRICALSGNYLKADFSSVILKKDGPYGKRSECFCPVCRCVHDLRVVHEPLLLETHNLYALVERLKFIHDMSDSYVSGGVKLKTIYDELQIRCSFIEFRSLVEYVQEVCANKFKPLTSQIKQGGLFGHKGVSEQHIKLVKRYEEIIKNYSKFYGKKF